MYTNLIYIHIYITNHGGYTYTHTRTHTHIHTSLIDDQGRDFRPVFDSSSIFIPQRYKIRRSSKRTVVAGQLLRSTLPPMFLSRWLLRLGRAVIKHSIGTDGSGRYGPVRFVRRRGKKPFV